MPRLFRKMPYHLLWMVAFLALSQHALAIKTYEYQLDNGMKVIVRPIHRAPVAVSMVWYKVGSADEHRGITGISHVLEHMMFKGTNTLKPGEFSTIIAGLGGQENAFTNRDYTAYFQTLKSDKLKTSFELEADRMENLNLLADELKKELEVVKEERRMRTDDNPQSLARERLLAMMHPGTPYHHSVIGWKNDLDNLNVSDIQKWYQKWYSPNNATLVVVGDVNEKKVLSLAKATFGKIKKSTISQTKSVKSLPPLGQKSLVVKAHANLPMLMLGYNVPSLKTMTDKNDAYALDVLAGILASGSSARLEKSLVREKKLASIAKSYYDLYARFDSEFLIYAIPSSPKNLMLLEKALFSEISALKTKLVSKEELARVKNQVIAAKTYEKDSLFGQAMILGLLETSGFGWKEGENYHQKINAVTAKELKAVANKYLDNDRLTIATLQPMKKDA